MEEIIANNNNNTTREPLSQPQQQVLDTNNNSSQIRRARPEKEHNINCPRCNSTNTKFCYYNNYSLTQPRYFCKTCRRYWTQGGSLRNVPVGGGSRKNKRSSSSSSISPSSSSAVTSLSSIAPTSSALSSTTPTNHKLFLDLNPPITTNLSHLIPPHKTHLHHHHGQDLNLAFPTTTPTQEFHATLLQPMEMPKLEGSLNSYVPVPTPDSNGVLYTSSGFPNLQELKPSLVGFSWPDDGLGLRFNIGSSQENSNNNNNNNNHNASGDGASARLLFPFGDINKFPSHHNNASATNNTSIASDHDQVATQHQIVKGTSEDHHHHHQGYWSGMLGGGTW